MMLFRAICKALGWAGLVEGHRLMLEVFTSVWCSPSLLEASLPCVGKCLQVFSRIWWPIGGMALSNIASLSKPAGAPWSVP